MQRELTIDYTLRTDRPSRAWPLLVAGAAALPLAAFVWWRRQSSAPGRARSIAIR